MSLLPLKLKQPIRPIDADLSAIVGSAAIGRAEGLGRVLDDRDAVARRHVKDRLEPGRMADQVDHFDRGGLAQASSGSAVQLRDR